MTALSRSIILHPPLLQPWGQLLRQNNYYLLLLQAMDGNGKTPSARKVPHSGSLKKGAHYGVSILRTSDRRKFIGMVHFLFVYGSLLIERCKRGVLKFSCCLYKLNNKQKLSILL